jgi:hypothetical protein
VLIKCVRYSGARDWGMLGNIVRRHWDARAVRRHSQGLSRAQDRTVVGEGAPHRRTEAPGAAWGAVGMY